MMEIRKISWASPHYWGNEQQYVLDALQSSWISGGPYVERLEEDFARYCDSPYAVSASNGTAALHMAYLAVGLMPGDEVIVPGFGFMAAANVALHVGARPVFSDVNPDTWCMTVEDVERRLTSKTKAIVPIHSYGNVCEMEPIMELAERAGLMVIEDAAEAIGSRYRGQMAGTIAPMGVYSFHATKTITTGEGGAVVTRDIRMRDRMRLFRSHGMSVKRYWHEVAGHNFRLTNMQAAIGCAQLEQIDRITQERRRVYESYRRELAAVDGVRMQGFSKDVDPLVWAVAVELEEAAYPQGRDMLMEQFLQHGVETRPGFYAANAMSHLYGVSDLPTSDHLSRQVISFPSSPHVTEEEIAYVCALLKSFRK